jgi:hypothetical protein
MGWWAKVLPVAVAPDEDLGHLQYRGMTRQDLPTGTTGQLVDEDVMLLRHRLSRIYYNKQFFDYPLKLNLASLKKLGLSKTLSLASVMRWPSCGPSRTRNRWKIF